jgi:hypothetical protein
MMFRNKEQILIKLFIKAFFIFGIITISAVSYGEDRNIPEFTTGVVDATDFDLTGHIIVITDRGRYYPIPDLYCDSFEMLVYEAVVIHPSGGIITSLEVGIPAIYLDETLIPRVEVWPGTRFEVIYVINCEAQGVPSDSRQHILELKKF